MPYSVPTFDELLDAILTDYKNQSWTDAEGEEETVDTSQGSLISIKSACYASALWGLYQYQLYISKQIFPDSADSDNLAHHGWVYGLAKTYGENDADYLARLLNYIQQPPAGGNQNDYVEWALDVNNVEAAYCFPLAQGLGTIDVVITANIENTGSELPSSYASVSSVNTAVSAGNLVDAAADFTAVPVTVGDTVINTTTNESTTVTAVTSATQLALADDIFTATPQNYTLQSLTTVVLAYINRVRPVTASVVRVLPPTILLQNVTMTLAGPNANSVQAAAEVAVYMQTLIPEQTLALSQISAIGINNGATDTVITTPAANVVPGTYQMIRPGVINVT